MHPCHGFAGLFCRIPIDLADQLFVSSEEEASNSIEIGLANTECG